MLSYQLGLRTPTLNYFIIAMDAERRSADQALSSLWDKLLARHSCIQGSQTREGEYYKLVYNICKKPLNLLLMVQGLISLSLENLPPFEQPLRQHAIEDFIIYLLLDKLRSLLCEYPKLLSFIKGNEGYSGKKLAALAALITCYPRIDEAFFRYVITSDGVAALVRVHDGLDLLEKVLVNPY